MIALLFVCVCVCVSACVRPLNSPLKAVAAGKLELWMPASRESPHIQRETINPY